MYQLEVNGEEGKNICRRHFDSLTAAEKFLSRYVGLSSTLKLARYWEPVGSEIDVSDFYSFNNLGLFATIDKLREEYANIF